MAAAGVRPGRDGAAQRARAGGPLNIATRRLLRLLVALPCAVAGMALAAHHPLAPGAASMGFGLWLAIVAARPAVWLFVLPAVLPVASLAPWTGWTGFDEFDLLWLGALAGGYARWAFERPAGASGGDGRSPALVLWPWLMALSLFGLFRGLQDAGWTFGWFQSYADPLNSVRAFKGPAGALALWPLLQWQLWRRGPAAAERLALGMVVGLTLVSLAVLWERAAYPGLWDFSAPYRASAMFWEMHVGGAAIDAYLALAMPFVAWALGRAKRPLAWAAAGVVALLGVHACLVTFSRGVYLAVALPMVGLGVGLLLRRARPDARAIVARAAPAAAALLLALIAVAAAGALLGGPGAAAVLLLAALALALTRRRPHGWRRPAAWVLSLLVGLEVLAVLGTGTYMFARMASSDSDFGGRLYHWRSGVGLLVTPAEWAFGLGLGRLPASYARFVPYREFPGAATAVRVGADRTALRLAGPRTVDALGGTFMITQRVPLLAGARYTVRFDVRAPSPTEFSMAVCEMHLIFERDCQWVTLQAGRGGAEWQRQESRLDGPALHPGPALAPRGAVFAIAVHDAGGVIEIADLSLRAAGDANLLRNGDFARGLAHWLPAAQYYYLPWHIDNLYLEWLIERGVVGLVAFLALAGFALRHLTTGGARGQPVAPFVAASLAGGLTLGLLSSVMDVPRVAFLLFLLLGLALAVDGAAQDRGDAPPGSGG